MGLFDRHPLPAEVRDSLAAHLAGEGHRTPPRVLAWASTRDGVLVALPDLLAVRGVDGWTAVPWHTVHAASWTEDGSTLTYATVDAPRRSRTVAVTDPGRLPEVVRERVEQTFVVRQAVQLAPGRGAVVSGRRPADGRGEVSWHVAPGRGVNLADPQLAEAARGIVERIRGVWG